MDFVGGGGSGGGLGSDNGPILFSEPNRTSAIDDLRSLVIYIFIITIFISFFLILPGIRNDKLPTFLCIIPSLIVTSIILIALFGTTWHVGQAPISAPYKAFSKDRIQGELSVKIGLRSVNITLRAHKYYELHASHKPVILDELPIDDTSTTSGSQRKFVANRASSTTTTTTTTTTTRRPNGQRQTTSSNPLNSASNLAEELLGARGSDVVAADTELDEDEADFSDPVAPSAQAAGTTNTGSGKFQKRSTSNKNQAAISSSSSNSSNNRSRSSNLTNVNKQHHQKSSSIDRTGAQQRYTIERSNVDINYNERFYWIEPNQMRQEHHNALERGLPYPILTVVEYLSQDEAGFSWSRQYRLAGYYSYVILWLSLCVCVLMFFLHCAAPKYGIYTMQCLGCLMLFTNFTYATLVPRGDQKLVIPFEGRSLSLQFGWNYWLVLIGGCLSLSVGTLIVIIDSLFPNFIFTTILDVDFDSHKHNKRPRGAASPMTSATERLTKPPFYEDSTPPTPILNQAVDHHRPQLKGQLELQATMVPELDGKEGQRDDVLRHRSSFKNDETSDSEMATKRKTQYSSVVEMSGNDEKSASSDDAYLHQRINSLDGQSVSSGGSSGFRSNRIQQHLVRKNNLKSTDHQSRQKYQLNQANETPNPNDQVRL